MRLRFASVAASQLSFLFRVRSGEIKLSLEIEDFHAPALDFLPR
jgi:hypothetical protein